MSDAVFSNLSDAQLSRVHAAAEEFEKAFLKGDRPSIEAFLGEADVDIRPHILQELLSVELELRLRNGEAPCRSDYMGRFAEHQKQCDDVLSSHSVPTESIAPIDTVRLGGLETDCPAVGEVASDLPAGTPDSTAVPIPDATRSYDGTLREDVDRQDTDTLPAGMPSQFGRYRITQVLGSGGMGTVYRAHDEELGRDVALKVPDFAELRDGDHARERFRREAKTMAAVEHPNLCPVYDVGEIDGRLYLTMACISGPTLHERITGGTAFDEAEVLSMMSRLARAVQHAHDSGVVHRDLKPANVMINERGEPIVMDFGLAQQSQVEATGTTQDGRIVGTPLYMAPEQVEGDQQQVGPRSDVYALGVILYHMLCGQPPFEGSALSILGRKASGASPPSPSELAAVASDVEAIVLKAMAGDVDRRYQTAAEFADALDAVQQRRESDASAVPPRTRSARLAAVALVLTLLAAVATYMIRGTKVEVTVTAPEDVDIELRLTGDGRVISVTSGEGWSVRARPGTYEMSLHPVNGALPEGVEFSVQGGNTLTVSRDRKAHVTIVRRDLLASGDSRPEVVPFADSGQRIGDNTTTDVALVDVNGDGALDAVRTPYEAGARNEIWLNNGKGVLEVSSSDLGTTFTTSVASADVDGDGDADVVLAGRASPDELWINKGEGEFTRRQLESRSDSAEIFDADGDGDPDLLVVVADPASKRAVRLLLNDGEGVFEDSQQRLGNWTRSVVPGDVDGDGDLDFVAVNEAADEVWLNDGAGFFFRHPVALVDSVPTQQYAMGDLDGDGDFDLVAAVMHSSNVAWFNDGTGTFTSATFPGIQTSKTVALTDVEGDGDLDIIFGDAGPVPDYLWLNDGKGYFQKPSQWFPQMDTQALAVGDLDGDGREDLYLAHGLDEPDRIWRNSMQVTSLPESTPPSDSPSLVEARRHRRPQDLAGLVPQERGRDQRHTTILKLGLLNPDDVAGRSHEEIRSFLVGYLKARCGNEAAAIESLTTPELIWNISLHAWLATLEVRDALDLTGYSLDEQRNLAISILGPLLRQGRELQGLTNADLMLLVGALTTPQAEPVVTRIARQGPAAAHTNADTLIFRVTFNKPVQNVAGEAFVVEGSMAVVTDVRKLSTLQYDVTVSAGDLADFNGIVKLRLQDATGITDLDDRSLIVSDAVQLESYVVDNTAPTVAITQVTPDSPDSAAKDSVTFNVTFNEPVVGPAEDGLVSYFAFEDSLVDSVDGVLAAEHGDIQFDKGRFGKGIVLDERDFVRVLKDVTQKTLPEMSWGAWVRLAEVRGDEQCVQVLCADDTNPADYDRSLAADIRDSGGRFQWSAFRGGQPDGDGVGSSGVDAMAGEWTFIAATYDNQKSLMTLYVNDTSREMSTNFTSGHRFFDIGSNPFFSEYFHGTIDEVFVFDRVLTQEEIERIRDTGFALSGNSFEITATGSARASDAITITDADDNDQSTFTVTLRSITGTGSLGLLPAAGLTDLAGNPLNLTPATAEQHEISTR